MLHAVTCAGYKAFAGPTALDLRALNVIFGKNNSGKTSLARLPLFVASSLGRSDGVFATSRADLLFGSDFADIANAAEPHPSVAFGMSTPVGTIEVRLQQYSAASTTASVHVDRISLDGAVVFEAAGGFQEPLLPGMQPVEGETWLGVLERLQSPIRASVQRHLVRAAAINAAAIHVPGARSQLLSSYELRDARAWDVSETAFLLARDPMLQDSVSKWYEEALDGARVIVDRAAFAFRLVGQSGVSLARSGRGVQAALPVVTLLEAVARGLCRCPLVVVEEPEAHLHPSAHGSLADLALRASARSCIVLETHSEHLVLRLQRAIAERRVEPDSVRLLYVDMNSVVTPLEISATGEIPDWPTGVFEYDVEEASAIVTAKLTAMGKH